MTMTATRDLWQCTGLRGCGEVFDGYALAESHFDEEHADGFLEFVRPDKGDDEENGQRELAGTSPVVGVDVGGRASPDLGGPVPTSQSGHVTGRELASDDNRAMYRPPEPPEPPAPMKPREAIDHARDALDRAKEQQ